MVSRHRLSHSTAVTDGLTAHTVQTVSWHRRYHDTGGITAQTVSRHRRYKRSHDTDGLTAQTLQTVSRHRRSHSTDGTDGLTTQTVSRHRRSHGRGSLKTQMVSRHRPSYTWFFHTSQNLIVVFTMQIKHRLTPNKSSYSQLNVTGMHTKIKKRGVGGGGWGGMEKSFCGFINLLIFAFKLRVSKCPVVKKRKERRETN